MKIETFGVTDKEVIDYLHSVYDGVEDYMLPPNLPMPKFDDKQKELRLTHKLLKIAYDDLYFFTYYILGAYFTHGHAGIPQWQNIVKNNRYVCILQSRDHLKSVFFTWAYPLWKILFKKTLGVLIEAYNTTEANRRVELIKATLTENEWFKHEKNTQGTWGTKRLKTKSGIEVSAGSPGQALRGRHPDLIIADDIESEKGSMTFEYLKYYISSVLIPMLPPKSGQLIIVGTPLTDNDLYAELKQNPEFYYNEYPAINNNGELLWYGHWTAEALAQRKAVIGELTFNREYLMKPISTEDGMFDYSYIVKSFDTKLAMDTKFDDAEFCVMGNDYQRGSNKKSDYSVFTILTKKGKHFYLNHMEIMRGQTVEEQVDMIERLYNEYDVNLIVSENNGFQSVFIEQLEKIGLPVSPFTTTKKSKFQLLTRLRFLFEKRMLKIPKKDEYDEITELVHQLTGMVMRENGKIQSLTAHDDMVMSLQIQAYALYEQTVTEEVLPSEEMIPDTNTISVPSYGVYGQLKTMSDLYDDRWNE